MKPQDLKIILDNHKLWIESEQKQGKQANLVGANLMNANLEGANLEGTILEKKEKIAPETTNPPNNLRSKFDEFAKSLGVKIVSLKIEKTEIIDL